MDSAWDRFRCQFNFRPQPGRSAFPAIDDPQSSVTYSIISPVSDKDVDEAERVILNGLRQCTKTDDCLYQLDWQHQCYWVYPHLCPDDRGLGVCPDVDYIAVLAQDFNFGFFIHPWEESVCVFGAKLLAAIDKRPQLFDSIIRQVE